MNIKIILTTTDSNKTALKIAELLISKNISPCVQIMDNIQSIFQWDGKLKKSNEILISIKCLPEKVPDCKELILKHHNYKIPEIIIQNSRIILNDYSEWFVENG